MDKKDFYLKTKLIREEFKDKREIKCVTPKHIRQLDSNVHQGGDIFTTEDGEFIDLEFQLVDFDEEELVKYVEFAEHLYEKHHKKVSIYLLCPRSVDVLVSEFDIVSDADFTIKLSCSRKDPCELILQGIKEKIRRTHCIDKEELDILKNLPMICDRKNRTRVRLECFKLVNRFNY